MMAGIVAGGAVGGGGGGGDPHWANVVLLCGFEGPDASTTFVDESSYARTLTAAADAQIDTSQFKFGASSAQFDGSGDVVSAAHSSDLELGSGPFTIETFVRFTGLVTRGGLLSKRSGTSSSWTLRHDNSTGFLGFVSGSISVGETLTPALGTWYFLTVDFDGVRLRYYRDGVKIAHSDSFTSIPSSTDVLYIGANRDGLSLRPLNGRLDEVRITKGVARYATDGSFAVPTEAFPRS